MSHNYVENDGNYQVTNLREAYAVSKIKETLPVVLATFSNGNKDLERKLLEYYIGEDKDV